MGTIEKALEGFGLTKKEVEIYVFLAKKGALTCGATAEELRTNKGLIFRVLRNLQKKGLVESTIEYPTRYTTVPLEHVIDSFIRTKKDEVALIEKAKDDLLSDWKKVSKTELSSSLERFSVIEGKKRILHKILQTSKNTTKQLAVALSVSDLLTLERFDVFDSFKSIQLKSDISIKLITQPSKQDLKTLKYLQTRLNPRVDFRGRNPNLGSPNFSRMIIRDKDEILLFISSKKEELCLSTNCKSIIQSFIDVFEGLWQDSIDIDTLIDEIKSGKSSAKTQIIRNSSSAKELYVETLNSAKKEVVIVTSSQDLKDLLKKKSQLEDWSKRNVSIKIMAPITNKNLNTTRQLLKWCDIRHIPLGYFETTVIDEKHLFRFSNLTTNKAKSVEKSQFANTLYTNDTEFIQRTKIVLHNIWKKTHTPNENIKEIAESLKKSGAIDGPLSILVNSITQNNSQNSINKVSSEEVLSKIRKEKRQIIENSDWNSVLKLIGSKAFVVISPPKSFALPNKMGIMVFHNEKESSFGEENLIMFSFWRKTTCGFSYVLKALIQDNPNTLALRKRVTANSPQQVNVLILKRDEIQVSVKGKTLFAGWTKPIPLDPPKYVLPPCCLFFEGYGAVNSGIFTADLPSGRRQESWFNSYDAFVTFFHPKSDYTASGIEAVLLKDDIMISHPPENGEVT